MTALDRARGWFIAPPPTPPAHGARTRWSAERTDARGGVAPTDHDLAVEPLSAAPVATSAPSTMDGWRPPVAGAPFASPTGRGGWQPPVGGQPVIAPPDAGAVTSTAVLGRPGEVIAAPPDAVVGAVTSAAVLGRPGEVEPIAAALALALRRQTRARAAAVAVVGRMPPASGEGSSGGAAARRLGARLEAHGLEARVRGRLAWVRLDPEDAQLVSAARRVTLVAAPAVLAITAPRTAAIDEALAEQDLLVIVTADPEGPLARLAATGLNGVPAVTVRPLGRGCSRTLANAGLRAPRPLRALLATVPEAGS
jgi:hypothetical protein